MKCLSDQKNKTLEKYLKDGTPNAVYQNLQIITSALTETISGSKNVYYERLPKKLNDPTTSSKTYCSIIKTFVSIKKVPAIPPILVNNKLVTNFKAKKNIFNDFSMSTYDKQQSFINSDISNFQ